MSNYIKKMPIEPSFKQEGLMGHNFELTNEEISLSYENVTKGHDYYVSNNKSTYYYFVIEGKGIFNISGENYDVLEGDVVEIPPKTKFVFKGEMRLLLISNPTYNFLDDNQYEKNDLY